MNTNPDSFESDLQALQRRELPATWRDEVLSAAKMIKPASHPPRWLIAGWSAAWAAILAMYFTTPAVPDMRQKTTRNTPVLRFDERAALIDSLLASN